MGNEGLIDTQATCRLGIKPAPITLFSSCIAITIGIKTATGSIPIVCFGGENDLIPITTLCKQIGAEAKFDPGPLTFDDHARIDDERTGDASVPNTGLTCKSAWVVVVVGVCGNCCIQDGDKSECSTVIASVQIPSHIFATGCLNPGQRDILACRNRNLSCQRVSRFDTRGIEKGVLVGVGSCRKISSPCIFNSVQGRRQRQFGYRGGRHCNTIDVVQ